MQNRRILKNKVSFSRYSKDDIAKIISAEREYCLLYKVPTLEENGCLIESIDEYYSIHFLDKTGIKHILEYDQYVLFIEDKCLIALNCDHCRSMLSEAV